MAGAIITYEESGADTGDVTATTATAGFGPSGDHWRDQGCGRPAPQGTLVTASASATRG